MGNSALKHAWTPVSVPRAEWDSPREWCSAHWDVSKYNTPRPLSECIWLFYLSRGSGSRRSHQHPLLLPSPQGRGNQDDLLGHERAELWTYRSTREGESMTFTFWTLCLWVTQKTKRSFKHKHPPTALLRPFSISPLLSQVSEMAVLDELWWKGLSDTTCFVLPWQYFSCKFCWFWPLPLPHFKRGKNRGKKL